MGATTTHETAALKAKSDAPSVEESSNNDDMMRRSDFLDRVAELTGERKNKVRSIVDATLFALGETLGKEQDAAIRPLGRVTVKKVDQSENGAVIHAKIKFNAEEAAKMLEPASEKKADASKGADSDED